MKKMFQNIASLSALGKPSVMLFLLCISLSCKSDVTISMNSNVPPSFTFKRGRFAHVKYLDFFTVQEIASENQNLPYMRQDSDKNIMLWQVWPKGSQEGLIDHLPNIVYGVVPSGFVQKIPEHGTPPSLVEGKVYEAGGPPVIMSNGFLRFTIKDGKAVQIPIPSQD